MRSFRLLTSAMAAGLFLLPCAANVLSQGGLSLDLWRRGAAANGFAIGGKAFVPPKTWTFTDRFCRSTSAKTVEYEDGFKLQWDLEPDGRPVAGQVSRTYSVVPRAFDAFRVYKTYTIAEAGTRLRIDWRFVNISKGPVKAGHALSGWDPVTGKEVPPAFHVAAEPVPPGGTFAFSAEMRIVDGRPTPFVWTERPPPAPARWDGVLVDRSRNRFGRTLDFELDKSCANGTLVVDTNLDSADGLAVSPVVCDSAQYDRIYPAEAERTPDGKARLLVRLPKRPPFGEGKFRCRMLEHVRRPPRLAAGTLSADKAAVRIAYAPEPPVPYFREKLERLYNVPVGYLETLCTNTVTYHEPWFRPSAETDVLFMYWPARIQPYGDAMENGKRLIVELLQRMNLRYDLLTLLPEVLGVRWKKPYGVYPAQFGDYLGDWTMARLRERKPPKVAIVNELDFTKTQAEAVEIFADWQKRGTAFVFADCTRVPKRLLGERLADEEPSLHLMPKMRADASAGELAKVYRPFAGGPLAATYDLVRCGARSPSRPEERLHSRYPVPYGTDFPYFDYEYLPLLKAIRRVSAPDAAIRLLACDKGGLTVSVTAPWTGSLETVVKDLYRNTLGRSVRPVTLAAGTSTVPFAEPPETAGGDKVAHMRLLDASGQVADVGAFRYRTDERVPLTLAFSRTDRIYPPDGEVALDVSAPDVSAPDVPAGCRFRIEVSGTDFRIVRRLDLAGGEKVRAAFTLPDDPDRLYAVKVEATADGRTLGRAFGEFAVRARPYDLEDIHAYITIHPCSTYYLELLRDLGFDLVISPFGTAYETVVRQCAVLGMENVPRNCADSRDWFRPWRNDPISAPAVRTPCFTDPAWRAQLEKRIVEAAEAERYDYYNVRHHWLGDECFLGATVCHSESCLAAFRAALARDYGTVDALNAEWGTSFGSFAEARPCQLAELADRDNLSRWLDHKMFMCRTYAERWAGGAREILQRVSPGSGSGPTGTQVPGYGYDWAQMMKYVDAIGYYGGAQRKLVHDFADLYGHPILAGQCGGGYTHMQYDYEPYNYDTMWAGLLKGANLAYHYFGMALDGDVSATTNMLYWAKSCRELKSGAGKLFLSGRIRPQVAVLYSQASLFAAKGTGDEAAWQNAQTSWWRLLSDLKFDFRFIPYEMLADGVPDDFRALVLPHSVALSARERASVAAFVARGGTVLADVRPGVRDGHGKTADDPAFAALFDGRRGVLLGADVESYNSVKLGGTGGETAASAAGARTLKERVRKQVAAVLAKAGIRPVAAVTGADGTAYSCDAALRTDGENRILALHLDTVGASNAGVALSERVSQSAYGRFDFAKGDPVTATFEGKGHVYDVREGRYLGFTDHVETRMIPGWTRLYSILAERPGDLTADGPAHVRAGETAHFAFAAENARGPQVFHVELTDPDGRVPWKFRKNVRTTTGGGDYVFETAFNEKPGRWTAAFVHVNTGRRVTRTFEIGR